MGECEAKMSSTTKVIGNVNKRLSLMDLSGIKTLKHPKTLNGTLETLICAYMVILTSRHFCVMEPPKVLGPPIVFLVLRTLDNPIDALNHSTSLVIVSSSFRPRALHPSRRYYITSEDILSGSRLQ
jgi:hypothetical protein